MLSSLRVRLVLWLLLPLSLFVAVCGWLNWRNAASVADYVQDHDLLSSAKVLSDRLIWDGDNVHASVPPAALSLFVSPDRDRVFLNVSGANGEVLAGSPDFPLPAQLKLTGGDLAQWYDTEFDGQPIRAVVTRRSMYDVGGARDITIAVGKTTRSRDHMLRTLWWPSMEYLLEALVLAILLMAVALTWELRFIVRLREQLSQLDPLRLNFRVDTRPLHTELRPVAEALNRFAQQLSAHSHAQRRFISDASHQLRTPLALQASQIEFARYTRRHKQNWESRRADMDELLLAMQDSNRRLVDVTNKLLLLAQAEHADAQTALERVDLGQAALKAVEHLAALADHRRIDLGVDAPVDGSSTPAWVLAQPALLDALVTNLLDNALRYTQEGGRVTVRVKSDEGQVELVVEDNGRGIPAEARERVFERFYRVAQDTEGTGLGLAIVQEIARAFGASVKLAPNTDEANGLRVTVRFAGLT